MSDSRGGPGRLQISPPRGWARVPEIEIPTWESESGSVLQYSLYTPDDETLGCTLEAFRAWVESLFNRTVFKASPVTGLSVEEVDFGLMAHAVLTGVRNQSAVDDYWHLNDRAGLGIFVSLLSNVDAPPEDLEAAETFVREMSLETGPLLH